VLILKIDKVLCFDALSQVFILKDLGVCAFWARFLMTAAAPAGQISPQKAKTPAGSRRCGISHVLIYAGGIILSRKIAENYKD
jgi:hypothetical protein